MAVLSTYTMHHIVVCIYSKVVPQVTAVTRKNPYNDSTVTPEHYSMSTWLIVQYVC